MLRLFGACADELIGDQLARAACVALEVVARVNTVLGEIRGFSSPHTQSRREEPEREERRSTETYLCLPHPNTTHAAHSNTMGQITIRISSNNTSFYHSLFTC